MRRKRWRSARKHRVRRVIASVLGVFTVLLVSTIAWHYFILRPVQRPRTQIYKGVFYQCIDIPSEFGEGKAIMTEIHWDEPGVELFFRPFYPRSTGRRQFTLLPADYLSRKYGLSVMINSTRYSPAEWWKSIPFRKVDSLETLVCSGRVSHMHQLSYMFGWDSDKNFHYEFEKPPTAGFLEKLEWGFGVQAINVMYGAVHRASLNPRSGRTPRTFVGVDPDKKILWFIVYDKVTEEGMAEIAQRTGMIVGGQLDAEDASTMIIGKDAVGVRPYTGIRGRRPLAGVMGVRAEPLERN